MISEMTLDQAIERMRSLEWRASEDWPMGYDPAKVRAEVAEIMAVFGREEQRVPERARPAWARNLRERIERKHFVATVQPKRRKVMA